MRAGSLAMPVKLSLACEALFRCASARTESVNGPTRPRLETRAT